MSDVTERLDEHLASMPGESDPDGYYGHEERSDEPWSIQTRDGAAWAAERAAQAQAEVEAVDAWEAEKIARIRAAAEKERAGPKRTAEFFGSHLAAYVQRLLAEGRTSKTLHLPAGKISVRKRPDALIIEDENAAIDYFQREHDGAYVRTKRSLDRKGLMRALERRGDREAIIRETGDIVTFARLEPQTASWTFTPAEPEGDS